MNLLKVLMFVFVSSLVCQNAYPQQDKFDSELGLFLKEKNYEAIQLGRFITGHLYLTAEVNGTNATFVLDTFPVSATHCVPVCFGLNGRKVIAWILWMEKMMKN